MIKSNIQSLLESDENIQQKARMQQRNGTYEQFLADSGKYLPAEFQVVRSGDPRSGTGKGLYIAFEAGEAEQLMTYENAKTLINENTEEIQNELKKDINSKINEANEAIENANNATDSTNEAIENANSATTAANEAAEKANEAAESIKDAVGIDDTAPYATKTYSSNKIEDMAQTNLLPEYMFSDMTKVRSNYEYVDKKLIIKDTQPTDTGVAYCHIEIDLKPNTNYTISWKSTRTGTAGGGIWINKKGGGATINKSEYNTLNGNITFNTGEDDGARILFVGAGTTDEGGKAGDSATFWDIMLVEGTSTAPYMENVRDVVKYTADIYGRFQSVESGSVLDIKKSGIYYVFNAVTDKPTEQGGMLNVAYESDSNRVYTFTGEGYAMWTRRFIGGKDSGWKNPLEDSDIDWLDGTKHRIIEKNTDLDLLYDVGIYNTDSNATAQTILNKPPTVTTSFFVIVRDSLRRSYSDKCKIQELHVYNRNEVFYRVKSDSTANKWTEWDKFTTSEEFKNVDAYSKLQNICEAFGLELKSYTMKEFLMALPRNVNINLTMNTDETYHITDMPYAYGVLQCYTGNTNNYNTALFFCLGTKKDTYRYDYIDKDGGDGKWEKMLSESDIANNFTSTDATKVAAAPTVKQLKEEIDELNGNKATAIYTCPAASAWLNSRQSLNVVVRKMQSRTLLIVTHSLGTLSYYIIDWTLIKTELTQLVEVQLGKRSQHVSAVDMGDGTYRVKVDIDLTSGGTACMMFNDTRIVIDHEYVYDE